MFMLAHVFYIVNNAKVSSHTKKHTPEKHSKNKKAL